MLIVSCICGWRQVITARKIFARVRNYCIYRIACTLQLIFFFFIVSRHALLDPCLNPTGSHSSCTDHHAAQAVLAFEPADNFPTSQRERAGDKTLVGGWWAHDRGRRQWRAHASPSVRMSTWHMITHLSPCAALCTKYSGRQREVVGAGRLLPARAHAGAAHHPQRRVHPHHRQGQGESPPSTPPPLLPSPPSPDRPIAWPWQVVPSPRPEHWNLPEIFAVSAALGAHLVVINVGMVSRCMPPKAPTMPTKRLTSSSSIADIAPAPLISSAGHGPECRARSQPRRSLWAEPRRLRLQRPGQHRQGDGTLPYSTTASLVEHSHPWPVMRALCAAARQCTGFLPSVLGSSEYGTISYAELRGIVYLCLSLSGPAQALPTYRLTTRQRCLRASHASLLGFPYQVSSPSSRPARAAAAGAAPLATC